MNCKAVFEFLDTWDIEDDTLAADLRGHLNVCSDCTSHYLRLINEQRAYTAYNAAITLTRDLWRQIEARIQPKPPRLSWLRLPGFMPVPAFAAVVIAITMFAGSMIWFRSERTPDTTEVATIEQRRAPIVVPPSPLLEAKPSEPTAVAQPVKIGSILRSPARLERRSRPTTARTSPVLDKTEAVVLNIEEKYTAAIASLSRELARQRRSISRVAFSQYESDLPQIDADIRSSRQAVRDQGYDPAAILSLNEAYDRKIDLLRNVVGK
jgi:hypothetical protein